MSKLASKWQKIIHRRYLVIRIPDAMVPDLCKMMECKHDSPRRIVMDFVRKGIAKHKRSATKSPD